LRANIHPCDGIQPKITSLPSHNWSSFSLTTLEDIQTLIKKIKPSSSFLDVVLTSLFLKVFDHSGPYLVNIINLSLQSGVVPSSFKQAIVNPILKKPSLDHSVPNNFRPISKLSFMSKTLEKVVTEQLTAYLEDNNLFDALQSGFRKRHLTETALSLQ